MRKLIIITIILSIFSACKQKENEISFTTGYYNEYSISTSGKITDNTFQSNVIIYYPPNYDPKDTTIKYPIIYFLHPFGADYNYYKVVYDLGTIMSYFISKNEINPAILVFVNGKNQFGGSFYVNSIDTTNNINVFGRYEDYIIEEVIPQVENIIIKKEKLNGIRYIAGYSMGGYGAMRIAHDRPDLFKGVASISGPLGFRIFADPMAQNLVKSFLKSEIKDSLYWVKYDSIFKNNQLDYATQTTIYSYYINSRFPYGFDTMALLLRVPDIYNAVYSKDTTIITPDSVIKTTIVVYRKGAVRVKSFSNFIIALSAAFSPKFDNCLNFNQDSTYIIAVSGANCIGLYLPITKDLNNIIQPTLIFAWLLRNDILTWYANNLPQSNSLVDNDIKVYISTGKGAGQDLEYVIFNMDSVLYEYMKNKYQSKNKDINQFVYYKILDGSTDAFNFPATHNQYVYNELGEVLKFFLKK